MTLLLSVVLIAAAAGQGASGGPVQPLKEAAHAIEVKRLEQAQLLIAQAIQGGAKGPAVDRLVADLAFASGDYPRALAAYETLLSAGIRDALIEERTALSALQMTDSDKARRYIETAVRHPAASWRVWNARGVLADRLRDWSAADAAYAKAAELGPGRAEIANNQGWSCFLRGRWEDSLKHLERAHQLDPSSSRILDNLLLARAAVGEDLPKRRFAEGDAEFAARLNDAGVVAQLQQQHRKAIAAFARALTTRTRWFDRAANNLEQAEKLK
jgi:tetratricopeptide (TPR) repeat protein